MKKLLILALFLTGCSLPPSQGWTQRYGSGVAMQEDVFSIPAAPGSVNYIIQATGAITGKTLTVTMTINSDSPVYALSDTTSYGAPQVHLFLERTGDEALTNPYGRWWCGASSYVLGNSSNVTLSCPLVVTSWTDVNGQRDATEFQDALDNVQWVGVTFGGANGWGHGVYMKSGSAQVQMQGLTVQ